MYNTVFYGFAGKGYDSANLLENYLAIANGSINYFIVSNDDVYFYTNEDFILNDDFFFQNCTGIECLDDVVEYEYLNNTDSTTESYLIDFEI